MRIAIYSDNQQESNKICHLIQQYPTADYDFILETFVDESALARSNKLYDMVFLDIEPNHQQSIKLATKINKRSPLTMIIFMAIHDWSHKLSLKLDTIQVLFKPIAKAIFDREFTYYLTYCHQLRQYLPVFYKGSFSLLDKNNIVYLETHKRLITAHLFDGKNYSYYGRLIDEEERLKEHGFIRIHKCYLVNLRYMEQFNHHSAMVNFAHECNKVVLPLSKQRYALMISGLQRYLSEK